jgi:hypothetical protein
MLPTNRELENEITNQCINRKRKSKRAPRYLQVGLPPGNKTPVLTAIYPDGSSESVKISVRASLLLQAYGMSGGS